MTNDGWHNIREGEARRLIRKHHILDMDTDGVHQIVFVLGDGYRLLLHLAEREWESVKREPDASL